MLPGLTLALLVTDSVGLGGDDGSLGGGGDEQVYSEIAPPDTDQLIKPSSNHQPPQSRRAVYAGT